MSITNSPTRRWMTPPPVYENARSGTTLKPYLTLPYILSLTWLAYPIISLLFVAFRLQISSSSAQDAVSDAKGNLLTSCSAAEKAATAAASLPRYMAQGSNKQIADAVNGTMNAARATLVLALTILEAVINFVIDIYRSTFFCFLELVVRGGLSILIGAVQEVCGCCSTAKAMLILLHHSLIHSYPTLSRLSGPRFRTMFQPPILPSRVQSVPLTRSTLSGTSASRNSAFLV